MGCSFNFFPIIYKQLKINLNIYKQLKKIYKKMQCGEKIHNVIVQMKCNM
jgi:hypothetical protein